MALCGCTFSVPVACMRKAAAGMGYMYTYRSSPLDRSDSDIAIRRRTRGGHARGGTSFLIVEVGAGTAVPTIRHAAVSEWKARPDATLVRINLETWSVPARGEEERKRAVSVGGLGALEALERIDALMEA